MQEEWWESDGVAVMWEMGTTAAEKGTEQLVLMF